jgi:hypothetical protein
MPNVSYFFEPLWFFGNMPNNSNFGEASHVWSQSYDFWSQPYDF